MRRRRTPGGKTPPIRLAGIGLVATGVAATLYVAGRVHIADPAASLFGRQYLAAVALKACWPARFLAWPHCRCC